MIRTKVVATIGPASASPEVAEAMVRAGMDIARINMSHGTHDEHRARYDIIRQVENDTGRPIAVLADLQGPKLRCGTFAAHGADLEEGEMFRFDLDDKPGDHDRVQLPHKEIFDGLEKGTHLLVNDGKIRLRDLGSTNGTYLVAGNRAVSVDEQFVSPDQRVILGSRQYTVKALLALAGIYVSYSEDIGLVIKTANPDEEVVTIKSDLDEVVSRTISRMFE